MLLATLLPPEWDEVQPQLGSMQPPLRTGRSDRFTYSAQFRYGMSDVSPQVWHAVIRLAAKYQQERCPPGKRRRIQVLTPARTEGSSTTDCYRSKASALLGGNLVRVPTINPPQTGTLC